MPWTDCAEWLAARAAGRSARTLAEFGRVARLTGLSPMEVLRLSRREEYNDKPENAALECLLRGTLEQQVALRMLLGEIPGDAYAYAKCRDRAVWRESRQAPRRS